MGNISIYLYNILNMIQLKTIFNSSYFNLYLIFLFCLDFKTIFASENGLLYTCKSSTSYCVFTSASNSGIDAKPHEIATVDSSSYYKRAVYDKNGKNKSVSPTPFTDGDKSGKNNK